MSRNLIRVAPDVQMPTRRRENPLDLLAAGDRSLLDGVYQPGKRALVKVTHDRTVDCAVAGYRLHKGGRGVGSLPLGLFDDDGEMHSVGVAAAFSLARRAGASVRRVSASVRRLSRGRWLSCRWGRQRAVGS